MNKIVKMVIEKFSPCYTQYRFNKASNFVSYEQFCEDKAIDAIIWLGKELERIKRFKNNTDEELKQFVQEWQDAPHVGMSDELFAKYKGIDASNELKRRRDEAYAIKMGWRKSS